MTDSWTSTVSQIRTSNLDAAVAGFSRLYGDSKIQVDGDFDWHARVATIGPLTLIQGSIDTVVQMHVTAQRHTLLVTRANSMHFSSAKGPGTIIPGAQAAMFSPGMRPMLKTDPAMQTSNFLFNPKFLEAQFSALTGEYLRRELEFENALALDSPLGGFINGLCHYLGESITGATKSLHPALMSNLVESLSRALLSSQPHSLSFLLEAPAPPSSRSVVRLVEEYVDAHAGGPIVAADLAFLEHRQTSPLSFLRERRLERARRLLLENSSVSIAHAAQVAGYLRIESFEAAYFKTFHESPVQTRQRGFIRAAGTALSVPETPPNRLEMLSDREREVCARVARGLLNKQIADELGITLRTVKEHRGRAMKKLGLDSTADLARLWERAGK
jgi:DNA-binding CsgD family transcriptional regulator